ncbi:MAG: hypothetical protein ACP5P9_01950 [Acidimicrobiales bacterium]
MTVPAGLQRGGTPRHGGGERRRRSNQWSPDPGSSPPPCWQEAASDGDRLRFACATLARHGIAVAPAQDGHPAQIERRLVADVRSAFEASDGAVVFWTAEEHARSLGPDGTLLGRLVVHVHGPGVARAATAAFEQAGLAVDPGPVPGVLLVGPDQTEEDPTTDWFAGIEVRGVRTARHQPDASEVSRRLEATTLCVERVDARDDGSFVVVLTRHDGALLTDSDVADALSALGGFFGWESLAKVRPDVLAPRGEQRRRLP